MASNQKVRRIVLTGAVTVITIAGSLYGAGIKTGQQVTQVIFSSHYVSGYWLLHLVLWEIISADMVVMVYSKPKSPKRSPLMTESTASEACDRIWYRRRSSSKSSSATWM